MGPFVLELFEELKIRDQNVKAQGEKKRLQKSLYLKGPVQRCSLWRQAQHLQEDLSLYYKFHAVLVILERKILKEGSPFSLAIIRGEGVWKRLQHFCCSRV